MRTIRLCGILATAGFSFQCLLRSLLMPDFRQIKSEDSRNNTQKSQIIAERHGVSTSVSADLRPFSFFSGIRLQVWSRVFCAKTEPSKIVLGDGVKKQTILVTGGAGFLGQHIVRLLEENAENINEIRIFDSRPYRNNLGHSEVVPVRSVVGDVRKLSDVRGAMEGVDAVIHTAGLVSFGTFPDVAAMQEINVQGTANVVQACVERNVSTLVYTSTVDVVIGKEEIFNGDESLAIPRKFLFHGYPQTKYAAERMVSEANGRILAKGIGHCLHTVCLRPNVMYGEGDPYYVINGLKSAKQNGGILVRIGDGSAKFQQAYVGNVAWAHLCALSAIQQDPGLGGSCFFVTDDTPLMNTFTFMKPFLRCRGFDLSDNAIPYGLVFVVYFWIDWILWVLKPVWKINLDVALPSVVYVNHTLYFNRRNAEDVLKYKPLHGYQASLAKSLEFYKRVPLNNK